MGKAWDDYGIRCAENRAQRDAESDEKPIGTPGSVEHYNACMDRWHARHAESWALLCVDHSAEKVIE